MKVLNIGTDSNILQIDSLVAKRAILISRLVDQYDVLVPGKNQSVDLTPNSKVIGVGGVNKLLKFFRLYKKAYSLLQINKYDLVTVQDTYYLAYLSYLLTKKFKTKLEIQVHGLEKFSYFRKMLAKKVWLKANSIRVVSSRLKNYLVNDFKVSPDKITVLPVLVDIDRLKNSPVTIDLKQKYPNQFIFLFVGRLVTVKNVPLIFKALAKLGQAKNYKLIIVGDGPEKEKLVNLANNLGLKDKVEFFGWVDNLASFYKSADCLVLASDSEGWPLVVVEARAVNLPIIMTNVGSAGELVKNNINGLVVPVQDELALSQALAKVITQPDLLKFWRQYNLTQPVFSSESLIKAMVDNWQILLTAEK